VQASAAAQARRSVLVLNFNNIFSNGSRQKNDEIPGWTINESVAFASGVKKIPAAKQSVFYKI
jgi:hypothetical protein